MDNQYEYVEEGASSRDVVTKKDANDKIEERCLQ